jgi:biotin transport system permease protein
MLSLTHPHKTPLHSVPASYKLLFLCVAATAMFAISTAPVAISVLLVVMAAYLMLGWDVAKRGASASRGLWPFVAVIAIWHAHSGDYEQGIVITARLLAAVSLSNLVTMTTRLQDMIDCLSTVARPLRHVGISPKSIAIAIAFVVRFIPEFLDRAERLSLAYRARSGRRASWRIILPLVFSALDDAEAVANALRARGGIER